jgi:cardiolipin synthase
LNGFAARSATTVSFKFLPLQTRCPDTLETVVVLPYIPNLLTLLRIAATPVLIMLLNYGLFSQALLVFVLAGVSDGLDGYIAKRFNYQTRLGAILDPVADKVLLVSCFTVLTVMNHLPFWLLVVVVFRDLVIVGGYLLLVILEGGVKMNPSGISKINTVLQICLAAAVLIKLATGVEVPYLMPVMFGLVTLTSVLSGGHYVWIWAFRRGETAKDAPGQDR